MRDLTATIADLASINANRGEKLVKGFTSREGVNEIQYAVFENGTVRQCSVTFPTTHFGKENNAKRATWEASAGVPDDAYFIGNYPVSNTR